MSYIFFTGFDSGNFCGDGSFLEHCSSTKPYYCNSRGDLVSKASVCGCEEGFNSSGEKCSSEFFEDSSLNYFKYILKGDSQRIGFVLYGGVMDYLDSRPRGIISFENETVSRKDFKIQKINQDLQIEAIRPLIVKIQNLNPDKDIQAKIAISLVQNIPYSEPDFVSIFGGLYEIRVARFPYQTLYEDAGSCEGKSELLAFLLRELGYGVSLFYYQEENHEAVGIKCSVEESLMGSGYCFIESTMPSPISYSEGRYLGILGSNKLKSTPQIILISKGLSLGNDLEEYDDSEALTRIVNRIDGTGKINFFEKIKFDKLRKKYGLLY